MTLCGDRVTCDVLECTNATTLEGSLVDWLRRMRLRVGFREPPTRSYVCPACRARYTDDQLRDLLARGETP